MKSNYFANITTLDDLKATYRILCKTHHPDLHPDDPTATARMQAINSEYAALFELLKAQNNAAASANASGARWTTETPGEFIAILQQLTPLDGLNIELCGSWLWISGNTYPHRDTLKSSGCRWSNGKKMWYWRHAEDSEYRSRGTASIGEIREKYGSERIASTPASRITA